MYTSSKGAACFDGDPLNEHPRGIRYRAEVYFDRAIYTPAWSVSSA